MAYKKKYAAKRRPRRAVAKKSASLDIVSLIKGYALAKLKQKLGLNTEEKFVDSNGTTSATGTMSAKISFPAIAQGLTANTRTGSSIRVTRATTRIAITASPAATSPTLVRVVQVRYLRTGAPSSALFLENTALFTSPYNDTYAAEGIQILKDVVVPIGMTTGGDTTQYLEWTHKAMNDHVVWPDTDTAGTPGAALKGVIYTFWMVENLTTSPVFTSTTRFYFVDN